MKDDTYDDLDRQLVHALQLDGRAPFSRIADVLGVSDQTVARRYTRLVTTGAVRVLGLTGLASIGDIGWMVRVQCAPDATMPVAEALARRPDTAWVHLLSGGTEIAAMMRTHAGDLDSGGLLLRQLPHTPRVVGVDAHLLLHEFYGGSLGLANKSGALTPEQADRLRVDGPRPGSDEPRPGPAVTALGDADRRMLAVLARDGRAGFAELAAATGWSQSTARRRLAELRAAGSLYLDVDYDRRLFGLGIGAVLWMSVPPKELEAAGRTLGEHPEVAFACATTGPNNLLAIVLCTDVEALYGYVTTRVAALPSVQRLETSPMIRQVKGPGPLIGGPYTKGVRRAG